MCGGVGFCVYPCEGLFKERVVKRKIYGDGRGLTMCGKSGLRNEDVRFCPKISLDDCLNHVLPSDICKRIDLKLKDK